MMKTFETDEIIGSYRVVRPLGTGGMGMVYEVEHTKLKVHRALKVFAVENENVELHRKRFLSEGKMLSALDHPRVIRVHEFDVDARSGLPYFVMDLVLSPDGAPRTLEDERRAGMEEAQAVRWFADVCEGLDYVHALGIVHRDVKLENVLIGPDGRAVLSDFGISRIFDDELRQRLDITLTMPQDEKVLNCLGSVHYLAPELQGANPEKATTSSDAWALGILLFRLLTGFWFENENREKCLKILDDYDLGWSPIVERLCAADPSGRIPVGGFVALAPVVPEASALPPPKRRGWLWGAVAALAVAAGVVGYIAFAPVPPPIVDYVPIEPEPEEKASAPVIETIPIPTSVQAAVLKAEREYIRRQFYDPVAKALEGESETNRVAWAGVLQTAEDMLKCFSEEEHVFTFYREYMGRGAEDAFKKGCSYPLPIAYAFSSLFKKKEYIQAAFQKAADNLEGDSRWNAATCLAFEYFFREKSSVSSVTNFAEREHLALRRFFKENEFSAKELGSVYRTLRLAAQHDAVIPVIKEVEAEGVKIDPWLKLMIDAADAYDRAWAARGSGFANTVTEEGWRIYHQEIVKVLPLLEKAYLMRPDLPQSTVVALSTCLGDREKMDLWLKRARASRADYCLAYGCYLWGLRPRWGGTTEEMADFILGVVKERHFESVSPIWAYENLVKYVFTYENGVEVVHQHFSNVNEFIKAERDIFEPYFEGYRKGQFYQKTDYINRVHIAVVLADLAWRLGNAEELLYWADEIEKLKVPVSVTEFDSGYKKYSKHLAALKKLTGYKRTSFMAGLRAMETDGDRAAIDAMIEIAREIGDTNLARDAAFARRGKTDLLPFLIGQPGLMAGSRVHDHLIFRVSVAEVEKDPRRLASFKIYVTSHQVNPETNNYITDTIEVSAGPFRPVVRDQPVWNHKEKSCSFEVEIVGNLVRLTQDGRRILEKRLHARPSNSKYFFLAANEVPGLKFTKIEWEARDDAAFVIPSEKREITIVEPPKVPQVATFPKYNLNKISMLPPPKGVSPICWSFCQPGEWREWRTQLSGGADLESTPSPVFRINTIPHGDNQMPIGGVLVRNVGSRTEGLDGATLVFNYADLDAGKLRDDFILASMTTQPDALRFNPKMTNLVDRLMVKCDPKTGIVSAVAQDNVKRWSGTEPMDLSSPTSCIIVTYDYAHGLSAYQRTEKGQPWRKLISAPLCRYRNEKSTLFSIGGPIRRTSQGAQGKVETGLQGALILSAALYPKVFTPKDFER